MLLQKSRVRLLGRWQGNAAGSEQHASSFDSKNNSFLMVAVHTKAIRHCSRLQYIAIGNNVCVACNSLACCHAFSVRERKVMFCLAGG